MRARSASGQQAAFSRTTVRRFWGPHLHFERSPVTAARDDYSLGPEFNRRSGWISFWFRKRRYSITIRIVLSACCNIFLLLNMGGIPSGALYVESLACIALFTFIDRWAQSLPGGPQWRGFSLLLMHLGSETVETPNTSVPGPITLRCRTVSFSAAAHPMWAEVSYF